MASQRLVCSSCKKDIANSRGTTKFSCPSCSKAEIVRCLHCRQIAAKYSCSSCGFEGPN